MLDKVQAQAWAKLILLGEYSVLYGYPLLGMSLEQTLLLEWDSYQSTWGIQGFGLQSSIQEAFVDFMASWETQDSKLKEHRSLILVGKSFPFSIGLGSSAALCLALSRLFNQKFVWGLSDKEILNLAYAREQYFHLKSSGADVLLSNKPGILAFYPPFQHQYHHVMTFDKEFYLLIIGIKRDLQTREGVQQFLYRFSVEKTQLVHQLGTLIRDFLDSTHHNVLTYQAFVWAVNQAHRIMCRLEFCSQEIQEIIEDLYQYGAEAGKISGSGHGGVFFLVCSSHSSLKACYRRFQKSHRPRLGGRWLWLKSLRVRL